jgi:hypothetical protein
MLCGTVAICLLSGVWSTARQMLVAGANGSSRALISAATANGAAADATAANATAANATTRPLYRINAAIDYELLTLKNTADITVPVDAGDALSDVVFFIFANAGGVGGDDERRKNIVVDGVSMNGQSVPFTLNNAVLRVKLAQAMSTRFTLRVDYHGVVPRSAPGSGGLDDMMGALGTDISGLLGGGLGGATPTQTPAKPKNTDYGLYTYGNGILSLGSFWYPSLAVRQNGKWVDEAPQGLGDVAYAQMSDFDVRFSVPATVSIATTSTQPVSSATQTARVFSARNVRDFAVLMSEDFSIKSKNFPVGGRNVTVQAYTTPQNAAKADKAIDIAGHALQIFSRRFGTYPYPVFKVVEGPMRGGAGGMEYSGMTAIASSLYGDMGKQIEALAGSMGLGGLDKLFGDELGGGAAGNDNAADAPDAGAAGAASGMVQGILGEQKQMLDSIFEATIAHEVAHQWWAIEVGSDSQRAPFVDESLTNYCAMLYFEDRYGKPTAQKMSEIHLRTAYSMGRMLGGADAPVALRTAAYANNLQYGAIVYGKGALYYEALRNMVGDEVFFRSLRQYAAEYSNRLAGSRAFLQVVQRNAPAKSNEVAALYKRWIEGTHGDDDITGGQPAGIGDLLGGILGGNLPGALPGEE